MIGRILFPVLVLLATGMAGAAEVRIVPQDSGVTVRLRGISAVSADVAWASGREGTVLRTVDGGMHWQFMKVPGAGELDFRDIEGFDADTAVVLSIGPGEASRIYRTEDGGKTWRLVLQNHDSRAFFDCMAFEGERGWLLGDPVGGRFQIHTTIDGGRTWTMLGNGPDAEPDEAAFAASGTCIARNQNGLLAAVTGGSLSRMWLSVDDGTSWDTLPSAAHIAQLPSGVSTAGAFSATSTGDGFLVVGGDFEKDSRPSPAISIETACLATEVDCSRRFLLPGDVAEMPGYRSAVACVLPGGRSCVAVGPTGLDRIDMVKGSTTTIPSTVGYDAIDLAGNVGWASGDAGRIARIEILDAASE